MQRYTLFFSVVVFFIFTITVSGFAETSDTGDSDTVIATGTGLIHGVNFAKAREDAISNSLINAVDRAVSDMVPIVDLSLNFKKIDMILAGKTNPYVKTYKVLAESKSDKYFRVLVQVTLYRDRLKKNIRKEVIDSEKQTSFPKILLFISEKKPDGSFSYWWGRESEQSGLTTDSDVSEILKKKGFVVVDHDQELPFEFANNPEIRSPNPDLGIALKIGAFFEADVIIIGNAVSALPSNTMNETIQTYSATTTLHAYSVATGKNIGTSTQTSASINEDEATGIREALIESASLSAMELSEKIIDAWRKTKAVKPVTIIVGGTDRLAHFVMFRKKLNEATGVENMRLIQMKHNEATILVNFHGTPKELAQTIMLDTFPEFSINLYEISDEGIRLELVSK